jgi:hypothetical protein
LHVHTGSAGTISAEAAADNLVVENSGDGGISILTPDANYSKITFGSPTKNEGAILRYNQASTTMTIGTEIASGLLQFRTGGGIEAMRITSGGSLKASTTGSYISASASYHELRTGVNARTLLVTNNSSTLSAENGIDIIFTAAAPNNASSKFFVCEDSSAFRFIVYSNGNVQNTNNSYGSLSDIKLKENIADASPKLENLLKVKIRNFNLIGETTKQIGVIAQELEEVFPSMIEETPNYEEITTIDEEGNEVVEKVETGETTKSVKYSVFVPMLIKAMQELKEIVDNQQQQINDLKAQLNG